MIVLNNLKAAVPRAHRVRRRGGPALAFAVDDEPAIHRTYRELTRHYGWGEKVGLL